MTPLEQFVLLPFLRLHERLSEPDDAGHSHLCLEAALNIAR